ncbi:MULTISPECIES: phosphotransferase [unclassified Brevundimonas]|uniref:phosphotransferase n=1 Tax=unclassified Brevundimonas TaxID=2622653 RepID=UPI0025C3BEF1|nr:MULTISPECIES: phosphotransferase [unclassified Brevundimonas]
MSVFEGAGEVRAGFELPVEALTQWLEDHAEGFKGPIQLGQFKGGQSNPTYRMDTPSGAYVLRRKPSGAILKGAHAVEREFRVISGLAKAGFPVARAVALCEDESVIGSVFYVMELVEGRIFWNPTLPDLTPEQRAAHFDTLNATIARLHSIDPEAIGLGDYGRPGNFFARQIERWSKQYLADELAGRDPNMDRLIEWLPAHMPADDGASAIIHGDYRADNLIFDADGPTVRAVLDWELSTLGHPMGDFTYHMMMYRLPPHMIGGFAGEDLEALGIPSETEYLKTYCDRTGRAVPSEGELRFYFAFNMFRFAAIFHGIKGRLLRGSAASEHAQGMADNFPELAALAWAQTGAAA